MSFYFCSGYAPDCVFKEFCNCLEYWNNPIDVNVSGDGSEDTDVSQSRDILSDDFDDDMPF